MEDVIPDQEDSGYGDLETSSHDSSPVLGSLPEEEAMYIIGEVLKALVFMHSMNIVHRDIKGLLYMINISMKLLCRVLLRINASHN